MRHSNCGQIMKTTSVRRQRAENAQLTIVVLAVEQCFYICKSPIRYFSKRRRDFVALCGSEESIRLEDFSRFNRGFEMIVNGASHEPACTGNVVDRVAAAKSAERFRFAVV